FAGVKWQITEGARFGLVGVNGSGKSTLLKLIAAMMEPESGRVYRAKNFTVGFLPQELYGSSERLVFDEALSGRGTVQEMKQQTQEVTEGRKEADPQSEEYAEMVLEYSRLQHLFEAADGFSIEMKTSRVLQGLAIPEEWWRLPMNKLSGGWQMR